MIVHRIINDTIGIVSHDPTLAHLWRRLAALAFTTPTRPHLASVIRHLSSAIRHPPSAICHLSYAIRHLPFAICHPPSGICHLSSAIRHLPSVIRLFSFPIPRSEFRIPHFLAERFLFRLS